MDFIALSNKSSHLIPVIITAAICTLCHLNINICCFGALDGNSFHCWGGGGVGERRVYRGLRFISDVIKSFAMDTSYLDQLTHLWATARRIKERRGEDSRYWTLHILTNSHTCVKRAANKLWTKHIPDDVSSATAGKCQRLKQAMNTESGSFLQNNVASRERRTVTLQQPQSFVGNLWVNTNLWTVDWSMLI